MESWIQEVINDLFEANVQNDNLVLLYDVNRKNTVKIKTPYGLTDSFELNEVILQGTVLGSLECSVQIDKLGVQAYKTGTPLFEYKNTVQIPPWGLLMIFWL